MSFPSSESATSAVSGLSEKLATLVKISHVCGLDGTGRADEATMPRFAPDLPTAICSASVSAGSVRSEIATSRVLPGRDRRRFCSKANGLQKIAASIRRRELVQHLAKVFRIAGKRRDDRRRTLRADDRDLLTRTGAARDGKGRLAALENASPACMRARESITTTVLRGSKVPPIRNCAAARMSRTRIRSCSSSDHGWRSLAEEALVRLRGHRPLPEEQRGNRLRAPFLPPQVEQHHGGKARRKARARRDRAGSLHEAVAPQVAEDDVVEILSCHRQRVPDVAPPATLAHTVAEFLKLLPIRLQQGRRRREGKFAAATPRRAKACRRKPRDRARRDRAPGSACASESRDDSAASPRSKPSGSRQSEAQGPGPRCFSRGGETFQARAKLRALGRRGRFLEKSNDLRKAERPRKSPHWLRNAVSENHTPAWS